MQPIIRTFGLTKRFKDTTALADVDLEIPPGVVFGYLGPNGAGKTTTIRLLTGLLSPTRGSADVMGFDTVREREAAQSHIGYLPGMFSAYPGLTGEQYLGYLGNMCGGIDPSTTTRLAKRLDLDLSQRICTLSHGNRQKLGIVQAFQHDPDVLILDEPTAGLDPLVQREFLTLLHEARDAGRTIFLSSHVLSEIEAVADLVGVLREGVLVDVASVSTLKARALRRIELTFEIPPPVDRLRSVPGVRDIHADRTAVQALVEGSTAELLAAAAPYGISGITTHQPDLAEIFMTYYAPSDHHAIA